MPYSGLLCILNEYGDVFISYFSRNLWSARQFIINVRTMVSTSDNQVTWLQVKLFYKPSNEQFTILAQLTTTILDISFQVIPHRMFELKSYFKPYFSVQKHLIEKYNSPDS